MEVFLKDNGTIKGLGTINTSPTALDTSDWQEFHFASINLNIIKPDVLHSNRVVEDPSGVPYIVRSKFNNGVKYCVQKTSDMELSPAGVITFGAENTTFFYQDQEFVSGRNVYYIDTQHLSKEACFFLITCLQPIAKKYSYSFGLFPSNLNKEWVKLPVTQAGTPDWGYMEGCMNRVLEESVRALDHLLLIK